MTRRIFAQIVYWHAVAATFLLPPGLCISISACSGKNDVGVIREIIQMGAKLAEEKRVGDLMDLTSEGFLALPGRRDARKVKSILFGAFSYYGQFKIYYPRPTVEVTAGGSGASAVVYLLIVQRDQSIPGLKDLYNDPPRWLETVGRRADLYQLKLQFEKNDGDWLVQLAQLEGFKGTGF